MKKAWSGRFSGKTSKKVEDFTESISFDRRLYKYDIMGSIAHARMLGRQGIITKRDAQNIVRGLKEIKKEIETGKFRFRTELEDIHMNVEHALIKKIGPEAGGKLHTARSRNDQVALDLRLYLRDETVQILSMVTALQKALLTIAEKHLDTVMPGYTHMQRAQPVLLSHHLLAYIEMLMRDAERLLDALKRINVLPLGACALAGTSLRIDRKFVAELLGFEQVSANSIDSVSDRDFALEAAAHLGILMMHLSRLSEELVLWASDEFSFITLPDAYATGSSIMPQKKNPDVAELIRGKTGRVYGNLMALLTIMKGLPLAYNRDMQEDKPALFDSVDTAKASLGVLTGMLLKLKFNKKTMLKAAGGGYSTATDMAEYLVLKGVPFREAHEITGRVVRHALDNGAELVDLTLGELKGFSPLFEKDVFSALMAEKSVVRRNSKGGTSPHEVKKEIRRLKKLLGR